jgi:hypothetical protein
MEVVKRNRQSRRTSETAASKLASTEQMALTGVIGEFAQQRRADPDGFKKDWQRQTSETRAYIRSLYAGTLDPQGSRVEMWDFVTTLALLFTVIVTPFEVCFLSYLTAGSNASPSEKATPDTPSQWMMLALNHIVNLVFIFDIGVNFFRPYERADGIGYERNKRLIARNYVKSGWLFIDVITVIPFDLISMAGVFDALMGNGANMSLMRLPRLMKLLRLVKLVRIFKASRILQRWQSSISLKHSDKEIIKWVIIILFSTHMFASLWGFLPQLMDPLRAYLTSEEQAACGCDDETPPSPPPSPQSTSGVQAPLSMIQTAVHLDEILHAERCTSTCLTDCEVLTLAAKWRMTKDAVEAKEHWLCRYRNDGTVVFDYTKDPASLYLSCVYVAVQMFAGGTGAITPMNEPEHAVVLTCVVVGMILWAIFTGAVCSIQTNIDPAEQEYISTLDRLNYLMNDLQMPLKTKRRARAYLMFTRSAIKRGTYPDVIAKFEASAKVRAHCAATPICCAFCRVTSVAPLALAASRRACRRPRGATAAQRALFQDHFGRD